MSVAHRPVMALSGGVGGAKLALGLLLALPPDTLTVVANTGDDFEHLGLSVSPDIDTLLYAMSERDDRERGWGRAGETWHFMEALAEIGGETWFNLGDRDLALHVARTHRLRTGETLSAVTAHIAARFGIAARILPMSDDPVHTLLRTDAGWMEFQPWFVGRRAEPIVHEIRFDGANRASLPPAITAALSDADLRAVILCPSNPYVSIDPILAIPGLRGLLRGCRAPVVAVSPLIGGKAVKGPTAKMMADFAVPLTPEAVVAHYRDILDGIVLDEADRDGVAALGGLPVSVTRTLMQSLDDRRRVASAALALADTIAAARP